MRDCLPVTALGSFYTAQFRVAPSRAVSTPALVRPAIHASGVIMQRKSKKTVKHQTAKMVGVAWMGLALMIMVSIVGAVLWLNPKDNAVRNDGAPAAQSATKLSPTRATTGSGKFD
jgi:hypothetical protein